MLRKTVLRATVDLGRLWGSWWSYAGHAAIPCTGGHVAARAGIPYVVGRPKAQIAAQRLDTSKSKVMLSTKRR